MQLGTRPRGDGSGYSLNFLNPPPLIHVSSIRPHTSVSGKAPSGGSLSSPDCTSVIKPRLVPQDTRVPGQPTSTAPTNTGDRNQPTQSTPPTGSTREVPLAMWPVPGSPMWQAEFQRDIYRSSKAPGGNQQSNLGGGQSAYLHGGSA